MFQKLAAGHPKFGAEHELRTSPWGFALGIRVAFGCSKRSKIRILHRKKTPKTWGRLEAGFRWYERAGERHERTQAVGLQLAGLQLALASE